MLKIRERYHQMSKGDKKISDFVLEHHDQILGMTAADIAQASGVSSASVIRYVKKMGADGLDGFKLELAAVREKGRYLTASQICARFASMRLSPVQVNRALAEMGFEQCRTHYGRFWILTDRSTDEMNSVLPEPISEGNEQNLTQ